MSRVRFAIAFHLAPISKITPGRTGTYHPHFYLLLTVRAEYFEPSSPPYISQAEGRRMWDQCLRANGHRIVVARATENSGEVAKYVTKPGAYFELDGNGWWRDPERLETLTMDLPGGGRSRSEIRRKLGFLGDDDDFDNLVVIDELDDGEVWLPFREVLYRAIEPDQCGSEPRIRLPGNLVVSCRTRLCASGAWH